ncbi:MAG: ATP-binding protein [Stellaceae bacterium]
MTAAARREQVLRKRQDARYDAVVENAPDVILTVDTDGNIRFVNIASEWQFGYTPRELVGQPVRLLFGDQDAWDVHWRALVSGLAIQRPVEMIALRKDRSPSHMEVSASRWVSDDRAFVSAILRDVNERHRIDDALRDLNATLERKVEERTRQLMQAEEALRQSQKMEAVGRLTGGIAHDFNNLLQGIMGGLDLIQKRIPEGRISDIDRLVKGALKSTNRAAALTQRLLAFSRQQPIDPCTVDIRRLIATTEELLRRTLGEATQMKIVAPEDLWLVRCDRNQLENALINLAINARDAMPNGGSLTIETSNVVLDTIEAGQWELSAGEYVHLSVRDTGTGMAPNVKARAFDPFFTTKPIGQGTGLGLSMIYGFVRQSGGSTRIESAIDQGTNVEICLPRFRGDPVEAHDSGLPTKAQGAHGGEIVLVVEDEGVVRLMIGEVLRDLGYVALEAADGTSALRIVQSLQRIDLLVTDIGLPGLNGRQLADAARVTRPNLKVLFMTGYAESAAGDGLLESRMELIAKPFTVETLARRIREIIEIT